MARGDMRYASTDIRVSGEEILNREVFEGIPMTIDFRTLVQPMTIPERKL